MLTETGDDTWVFEGTIPLSVDPASASDGILQTTELSGPPHQDDVLTATYNDAYGGTSNTTATTRGSESWFIDAFGAVVSVYATGSTVYVRIEDHNFNTDGVFDTVDVTVSSLATGDSEPLTLWETGKSTAIYEGSLALEDGGGPSPSDGRLQAIGGEQIEVVHLDWFGFTQSSARATLEVATIEFIDENGVPTTEVMESDWARIRVVSPQANADQFTAETVAVDLTTLYAADFETVTLTETGSDTGVFEGAIRVAGSPGSGPGFLDVTSSGPPLELPEQITAAYFGITATAEAIDLRAFFIDGWGRVVSSYAVGERIYVRGISQNVNDPLVVNSLFGDVTAPGESEPIMLTETGDDTGVFEGWIQTRPDPAPFSGEIMTAVGDTVSATILDFIGGESSATATMTGSAVYFLDAAGQIATGYPQGSEAIVRVIDFLANVSSTSPDTTWVDLTAALSGDSESLLLTETAADTGVFEGTIPLSLEPASPGNGVLETTEVPGPPHEFDLLTATYNDAGAGTSTVTATTLGSRTWWTDASGNVTSFYATGSTVYVRVEDHRFNTDDGIIDTADVTLSSLQTGDSEPLTLSETGASTGIYEGSLPLQDAVSPSSSDGLLQAQVGEQIETIHDDWLGFTQSSARATIRALVIEFIDENGEPTSEIFERDWARVRVVSLFDNLSPAVAESITAELTTLNGGDFETVTLTETGVDTNVFEGALRVAGPTGWGAGYLDAWDSGPPLFLPDEVTADYSGITATAQVIGSRTSFINAGGTVVTSFGFGERIYLRVFDQTYNIPTEVDSVTATLTAQVSGDVENLSLTETGSDTGMFEGWIDVGGAAPSDGLLDAPEGETVTATHLVSSGSQSSAVATILAGDGTLPNVTITSPPHDSWSNADESVGFTATAVDPEDGELSANISWTSHLDGALGTGGSISVALSMGTHTITAAVSDSHGQRGSDSILVTINGVPGLTITAPAAGAFAEGEIIGLSATAGDPEDGDLSAGISWTSDREGALGTGGYFSTGLFSTGTHTITAAVTDSRGVPASDAVTITITADSRAGAEFQVNSYTTSGQLTPDVSAHSDGSFVVVWKGVGATDTSGIQGQRYAAGGAALGGEFQINSYTTGAQYWTAVDHGPDGSFVVVWWSDGSDGSDQDGGSVQGQRFASGGTPVGGQFQVNTLTTRSQGAPDVAVMPNGDFVVVWVHSFDYRPDIAAQRFASDGTALGGELMVNTTTTGTQRSPAVATWANGDFVVVWHSHMGDASSTLDVMAQRFASDGTALGSEFRVHDTTTGTQAWPKVTTLANGQFVVVWSDKPATTTHIAARRFASDGTALGSEFRVNAVDPVDHPVITAVGRSSFVVAWYASNSNAGGDPFDVRMRRFDSAGTAVTTDFQINTYRTGNQSWPAIAAVGDNFVVAWHSYGSAGTDTDNSIQARLFRSSCNLSRGLAAGQWTLISPACAAGAADTVADVFGDDLPVGDYGDRWGIFDYNAVSQQYRLLALTDSLDAGDGYWIITYDSGRTIDTGGVTHAVAAVPLVADAASGRSNLVGHPFLFDVCWADVEVVDGGSVLTLDQADPVVGVQRACSMEPPDPSCVMSRIGYRWTGSAYASFDGVTPGAEGTLSSFQGLWVKAFKPGIGLRIPARESTSCSVLKTAGPPLKSSDGEWLVRLSAESGPLRDGSAVIGQLGASADGYDRHDLPKLEAEDGRDLLAIVFPHPGWGIRAGDYATDFHAVKPDGQADAWEFEVRSSAPGLEVTLRWEGPEWALADASLIDEVSGRPVTVQPDGSYTFRMRGTRHPFRWQLR
ncbi:MAG: hypothetical protein GY856_30540 [bacterium]|nr:hypothetical protein [bacterium]